MLPAYWYEGRCPQTGELLRLPRTAEAEAMAHKLMQQLASDDDAREGKMYGVLLVETSTEPLTLKAFSGLLNGRAVIKGWVPPIPGRSQICLEEAHTLAVLEAIKQELIQLQQIPRQQVKTLSQEFEAQLQQLAVHHQQRKQKRQHDRQRLLETLTGDALDAALEQLNQQSRQDGIDRRQLKRQQNAVLLPLRQEIERADARMQELKQQRKAVSRQLQAQMQAAYWLTNFAGDSRSLQQLMVSIPTGTGDCCAPKLLHYAATQGLKPIAMAEFWWGPSSNNGDKVQGQFYGACAERCQPLMGFLLSGLPPRSPYSRSGAAEPLDILYQDDWLIAVNKPAGLLSVPGRYHDRQDSVLSRLRCLLPNGGTIAPVHRLDQDTSGILLFARDRTTHNQLSQQFQQRHVHKVYEAVLAREIGQEQGVIDLPLWGDPDDRPYQKVDWQRGKPSITHFRVMASTSRLELIPITGRSHQLRVHAADSSGLGVPILGDRLYGCAAASRLHLHARDLWVQHPQSGQILQLHADTPF